MIASTKSTKKKKYARSAESDYISRQNKGQGLYADAGQPDHHVGETKSINGVTYRLSESHRWTRDQDGDGTADKNEPGMGGGQEQPKPPAPELSHEQRHEVAAKNLKSIEPKVGGLIRALHDSPEYKQQGDVTTLDVHPKAAKSAYEFLEANTGKVTGGGRVVTGKNGKLAFASAAGSFIVEPVKDPRNDQWKYRISYTHKTGIVNRVGQGANPDDALGNQQTGKPGTESPGQRPGGDATTGGGAGAVQPGGDVVDAELAPPDGGAPASQPGQPIGATDTAPPVDPAPLRAKADASREKLDQAVQAWETAQEYNPGNSKSNAHHRSNVAALRAIAAHHEKSAADAEKAHEQATAKAKKEIAGKQKAAAGMNRPGGGSQPSGKGSRSGLTPDEEATLRAMGIDPSQASPKTRQTENFPQPTGGMDRPEVPGMPSVSNEADAMARHGLSGLPKRTSQEQRTAANAPALARIEAGKKTPLIDRVAGKAAESSAEGNPPAELAPADPLSAQALTLPHGHQRTFGMLKKYTDEMKVAHSSENRQQVLNAIKKGVINNPRDLRTVLRTAKRLHERSNMVDPATGEATPDHPHVKEAISRKAKRDKGTIPWAKVKKQKAAEWDMTPDEFEHIAGEVWKDKKAHLQERKAAKESLEKQSGLTAAQINRLENQGFDSGSDHPDIPSLDTLGRTLASQYPALGWGPGAEGGEGGTDDTDYGELAWNLIREGRHKIPQKNSAEFITEVEDYLQSQLSASGMSLGAAASGKGGAMMQKPHDESLPFSRRGRAVRYAKFVQYNRLWDESKHPRGQPENSGEFAINVQSPKRNTGTMPRPKKGLRVMKVTQIGIEISKLANQVADVSAPALAATDCHRLPIVEILPSGRVEIVDGFHRIAGMIAAGETIIPCLTCDNEDVLAAAANAEDPVAQLAALKMIYA